MLTEHHRPGVEHTLNMASVIFIYKEILTDTSLFGIEKILTRVPRLATLLKPVSILVDSFQEALLFGRKLSEVGLYLTVSPTNHVRNSR